MAGVMVWGADGKPVEVEFPDSPGEGKVWVSGENGEPVAVPEHQVREADPGSPGEGKVWVWGENGEPVAVPEERVPGFATDGGDDGDAPPYEVSPDE